jgi:hypothetical protein
MARHEILREDLAALESRGSGSRPDNSQTSLVKKIYDSIREGRFGSHKSQIDLL